MDKREKYQENGEDEENENGTIMKLLTTKKETITEDEDGQDIVVEIH